jgi:hypothetical protein
MQILSVSSLRLVAALVMYSVLVVEKHVGLVRTGS